MACGGERPPAGNGIMGRAIQDSLHRDTVQQRRRWRTAVVTTAHQTGLHSVLTVAISVRDYLFRLAVLQVMLELLYNVFI